MKRKNKVQHEVEYEDAPSGYVTFYNYKEPLMKYEQGYGYVGALVFDGETDKIQCHMCGEWFHHLVPHLSREHNMKAKQYKDEVGLLQTTALISESAREKLIASGLDKRLQNLRSRKGKTHSPEARKKISETLRNNAIKDEALNLKGNCPAQLIDRLQKMYAEDPEAWRVHSLRGMAGSLKRVFGTIKQACLTAGVPYIEPGNNWTQGHNRKYTKQDVLDFIRQFIIAYHRVPTRRDFMDKGKRHIYDSIVKNSFGLKLYIKHALLQMDNYVKVDMNVRYTDKQLIDFIENFAHINKRLPSYSDCKRGLLPPLSTYSTRFKGFKNALKLLKERNIYEETICSEKVCDGSQC
jgi:hypothetical protein